MAEEELRPSHSGTDESGTQDQDGSEATVDEGIRLLEAFRAIASPKIRARILALAVTEARRSAARPPH